jgi:hypothetical protein
MSKQQQANNVGALMNWARVHVDTTSNKSVGKLLHGHRR